MFIRISPSWQRAASLDPTKLKLKLAAVPATSTLHPQSRRRLERTLVRVMMLMLMPPPYLM